MKLHHFLSLIPKPVRVAACVIVCCAVLIGVAMGITLKPVHCATAPAALNGLIGVGLGLLAGTVIAVWLLCLGYVHADARRRAMQPVLWTLIALLVPNLLGFLLYFALRRPITIPCPKCGHPIGMEQRFCAWCGYDRTASPVTEAGSQSAGAGPDVAD